jgi:TetR/AcrR family transcriptional regulator
MSKSKKTEQKILEAATELFLKKGVDRTSVREIANKAGINLALMNYYFRSKENLFDTIFNSLIEKNSRELSDILDSDKPLDQKVKDYVELYINLLSENHLLVSFVVTIVHRSNSRITEMQSLSRLYSTEKFNMQVSEEIQSGRLPYTSSAHFFIDMLSLIAFPFATKYLIMDKNGFNEDEFQQFIEIRKQHIPKVLLR